MSELPPPLPAFAPPKNNNGFASGAATFCLLSPLLVIGLGQALQHAGGVLAGRNLAIAAMAIGVVSCLLMLGGLILGILALLLMRAGGRASIVVRSLLGLTATGLLVAIAVPNFLHARQMAQSRVNALADVQSALKDLREQSTASLTNRGSEPTNFNRFDRTRLNRVGQSLGAAAQNSSGDMAVVLKAGQAYTRHLQTVVADYQDAHDVLVSAQVLATSNLVDRGAIAGREAVVHRFLACNDALKEFIAQGSNNFRAELVALQATDAMVAAAMGGFEKPAAIQRPILVEIRSQDDRMGAAMLDVLGLLDANWGHWRYTANSPHLHFENRAVLDHYNACFTEIREAGLVQGAAQRQLAGVIQQTASR